MESHYIFLQQKSVVYVPPPDFGEIINECELCCM